MKNAPSIIDVKNKYGSTELCVKYLEAMRWPNGVRCLLCGGGNISKFVTNETTRERTNRKGVTKEVRVPARHLYTCLEPTCGFQFSPTAGTIFHDTHLPLEKWFQAVALMCNAKKGLSAKQMERLYAEHKVHEPEWIAHWYARAGDKESAIRWLRIAYEDNFHCVDLESKGDYALLASDLRFQQLVKGSARH